MWLVRDGEGLASLEGAGSGKARRKGVLGRGGVEGALLLRPARSVHTIGMRFAIDVAYLDADLVVVDLRTMSTGRIGMPRLKARAVVEAEAGAFGGWNLQVGQQLEIKG